MEKTYTEFVTRLLNCIFTILPKDKSPIESFAETEDRCRLSSREFSVLKNKNAEMFHKVIQTYEEVLGVAEEEYRPFSTSLCPEQPRLSHSCYPKNLQRWLKGTVSRKKQCRVEFCVLVYCHAMNWSMEASEGTGKYAECRSELIEICNEFLGETAEKEFSFELLWRASCAAYKNSIAKK